MSERPPISYVINDFLSVAFSQGDPASTPADHAVRLIRRVPHSRSMTFQMTQEEALEVMSALIKRFPLDALLGGDQ